MIDTELQAEVERVALIVTSWGEWVSFDYRVKTHVAARLLGISVDALKKRRTRHKPPFPHFNGRSVTYFIRGCLAQDEIDLAA